MSRAFVKEPDGDAADTDLPERALSEHPQYTTPRGLRKLRDEAQALRARRDQLHSLGDDMTAQTQLKQVERDLRYHELLIQNAIVVSTPTAYPEIRFGATVEVLDEVGETHEFSIVGEHETYAATGLISWVSPLARALLGRSVGDVILWERPAGNIELEIKKVSYPGWN